MMGSSAGLTPDEAAAWPGGHAALLGSGSGARLTPFRVFAQDGIPLPLHQTQGDPALFQERICILCLWTVPLQFSLAGFVRRQTLSGRHDLPVGFSQFRALMEHGLTAN